MPLRIEENTREPWSRISDTRILRPKDELRLLGTSIMALIAVLDAHDPSHGTARFFDDIEQPRLPKHHHILVQLEGQTGMVATGLFVGVGEPEELIFPHVTTEQDSDPDYYERLRRLHTAIGAGNHGLYYVSSQEQLSATPEGQTYLNAEGGLLR